MRTLLATIATALLLLPAGAATAQEKTESDNPVTEISRPYEYVSAEGEFRVTWPAGCGQLRRRSTVDDPEADPFETVRFFHVSCDRYGQDGAGCSVAAVFNQLNEYGGMAGPKEVVDLLEEQLGSFGVQVVEQTPINRVFADGRVVEGLDIKAVDDRKLGQVWLRGVLSNGDIYILAAWDLAGGVWDNPEYMTFFDSFLPGTE